MDNKYTPIQQAKMDEIKKLNSWIPRHMFVAFILTAGTVIGGATVINNFMSSEINKSARVPVKQRAINPWVAGISAFAVLCAVAFLARMGQGRWDQRCFERAENLISPKLTKKEFEEICEYLNMEMLMRLSKIDRKMLDSLIKNDALSGELQNNTIESIVWMIAGYLQSNPDEYQKVVAAMVKKYPQIKLDEYERSRVMATAQAQKTR